MAIARVNAQSNQNGSGSGSLSVTKPTGLANGHVVFLAVEVNNESATITPPSGFTVIRDTSDTTNAGRLITYYKVITNAAGEPANYTFNFSPNVKAGAGAIAYSGVDNTAPVVYSAQSASATPANSTIGIGSFSLNADTYPVRDGAALLAFIGLSDAGSFTSGTNSPTEIFDITSGGGGSASTKIALAAYEALPAIITGGDSPFLNQYTVTEDGTNGWIRHSIVIQPDTGGTLSNGIDFGAATRLLDVQTWPIVTDKQSGGSSYPWWWTYSPTGREFVGIGRTNNTMPSYVLNMKVPIMKDGDPSYQASFGSAFLYYDQYIQSHEQIEPGLLITQQQAGSNYQLSAETATGYYVSRQTGTNAVQYSTLYSSLLKLAVVENKKDFFIAHHGVASSFSTFRLFKINQVAYGGATQEDDYNRYPEQYYYTVTETASASHPQGLTVDSHWIDMAETTDNDKVVVFYKNNGTGDLNGVVATTNTGRTSLSFSSVTSVTAALKSTGSLWGDVISDGNKGMVFCVEAANNLVAYPYEVNTGTNTVTFGTKITVISGYAVNVRSWTPLLVQVATDYIAFLDQSGSDAVVKYYIYDSSAQTLTFDDSETLTGFSGWSAGQISLRRMEGNALFVSGVKDSYQTIQKLTPSPPAASVSDSHNAYIGGLLSVSDATDLFIHGFQTTTDSHELFIGGNEPLAGDSDLYVHGYDSLASGQDGFVNGAALTISSSHNLFLHVADGIQEGTDLFIYGLGSDLYGHDLFVRGMESVSSSHDLFIYGMDNASDTQDLFIHGLGSNSYSHNLFIPVDVGTLSDSHSAFIYGGYETCLLYNTDPNIQVTPTPPVWQVQTWNSVNGRIDFAWRRENQSGANANAGHYWENGVPIAKLPGFSFNWRLTYSDLEQFASTGAYKLCRLESIYKDPVAGEPHIAMRYTWDTDHGVGRSVRGEFYNGTTTYVTSWQSVSVGVDYSTQVYVDRDTNEGVFKIGATTLTVSVVDASAFFDVYDMLAIPSSGGTTGSEGINESYALGYIYDTCITNFDGSYHASQGMFIGGIDSSANVSSSNDAYLYGHLTTADNHLCFIRVALEILDSHNSYIEGTASDIPERNASFYAYSQVTFDQSANQEASFYGYSNIVTVQNLSDNHSLFVEGFLGTTNPSIGMFISGPFNEAISQPQYSYMFGALRVLQSSWAYTHGHISIGDSLDSFIFGSGSIITDSHNAFIKVRELISDSHSLFIHSSGPMLDGHAAFISGEQVQTDYGALRFDKNKSQYVQFNDSRLYSGLEKLTVNCWIRFASGSDLTNHDVIIHKTYSTNDRTFGLFKSTAADKIHFGVRAGGVWSAANSISNYTLNEWVMVTLVYDGAACKLYMNGAFDNSFAKSGSIDVDNAGPIQIAYRQETGRYTTLDFADLTIWNYALDASEIGNLYHNEIAVSAIGAHVQSADIFVASDQNSAYIEGFNTSSNPQIISSSTLCVVSGGSLVDGHSSYVVGAPVQIETFDTQIILDNFKQETFDLVVRFMVQGDRARRFQDADVLYPITRARYRDLPNIYYPDIPGREFVNQELFLHSGWAYDTHYGDLSGVMGEEPRIQMAYLPTLPFEGGMHDVFIQGHFTPLSSTRTVFIQGAPTENVDAYIEGTEIFELEANRLDIFIRGLSYDAYSTRVAFIKGGGAIVGGFPAYVVGINITGDYQQAFVNGENIEFRSGLHHVYLRAGVIIERSFPLYMNAHLFGFDDFVPCFIQVQPTVEDSQGCYVACPWPYIHEQELLAFIHPNAPIEDGQMCHISAEINIVDGHNSFIHGNRKFESSRNLFLFAEWIIYNKSDNQKLFISSPYTIVDSHRCVVNAGVASPSQNSYIFNIGSRSSTRFAIIFGPAATDSHSCFVSGT